jgi:WD40 repeat protein
MAPEQLTGGEITPRADIYSLALVLYEVLTARAAFSEAEGEHIVTRRIFNASHSPIELDADLPESIKATLFRATFKDPADRHDSVRDFIEDFERAVFERTLFTPLPSLDIADVSNPYKGLRSFEEADALDFFGRDALIGQLLDRLREDHWLRRFLAVVGPSGGGKSSAVKAGLIPALRHGGVDGSEQWFIVEIVPGATPLRSLESALLSVAHRPPPDLRDRLWTDEQALVHIVNRSIKNEVLLVVDQFEETYTLCTDEEERQQFLYLLYRAVLAPTSRVRVLITLRADFYDRPLLDKNFGTLVQNRTQVVLPMSAKEIEQAIVGPAHRIGLLIDPDLIASMIADVNAEPGALPLLQYALTELFEQRDGIRLSAVTYGQIGGISGVLAKRAAEVYEGLDAPLQTLAKQILLRLVAVHEGQNDARRRVRRAELLSLVPADQHLQVDEVLNAFGKHRLFTFDFDASSREPLVEIAHEALLRTWDQLQTWLETSRNAIRMERLLANAAHEWIVNGRTAGYLLQGTRLAQFREWANTTDIVLTPDEHAFLSISITEEEQRQAIEAERRQRVTALERRNRIGLWLLVVGTLTTSLLMIFLATSAHQDRQIAQGARATSDHQSTLAVAARATADRRAEEASSIALAANAQMMAARDPLLALPLALAANRIPDAPPFANRALSDIAYRPRSIQGVLAGHDAPIYGVAYTPDGQHAITASYDRSLRVWNATTGQPLRTLAGHTDGVTSLAALPDGARIVSGAYDGNLIVWDIETGQPIRTLAAHQGGVMSVAASRDGGQALSGGQDALAILWDVERGERLQTFRGHSAVVAAVGLTADGKHAITGSYDDTLIYWDVATGKALRTFRGHRGNVNALAISPDDRLLISGGDDKTLILWDVQTGAAIRTFAGHTDLINAVTFAPDGKRAISGAFDQQVLVWDVQAGQVIQTLVAHTGAVYALAISPGGQRLVTGSTDRLGILWNLEPQPNGARLRSLTGHTDWVNRVALSPDGWRLVTAGRDNWAMVWDVETGAVIRQFRHRGIVWDATFSPTPDADGHWLALTGDDAGVVSLWDVEAGKLLRTFEGHSQPVNTVAFSPDGRLALSASDDGTLILWDVQTSAKLRVFDGHTDAVNRVVFFPDGKLAISASTDRTLRLWNVETGRPIRTLAGHTGPIWDVVVTPDGRTAVSASTDATLIVWDLISSQRVRTLIGHSSIVWSVALSPDGAWAASGSDDKSILVWDVARGEAIRVYHTAQVPLSVRFSRNGQVLFSGLDDYTVSEWRIDTLSDLIDWTYANRVVRDLTCAENATYRLVTTMPCR